MSKMQKVSHQGLQTSYWTKENNTWTMTTGILFMSNERIIHEILKLPTVLRELIKAYWMMMYYLPKDETMDIHSEMRDMFTRIPRSLEVFDVGNVYYPRCRGYCFNCGEPARKIMGQKFGNGGVHTRKLVPAALMVMRLCYTCNVLGYKYKACGCVTVPDFTQGSLAYLSGRTPLLHACSR